MYATVKEDAFDPVKLAQGGEQFAEFQALHARPPAVQPQRIDPSLAAEPAPVSSGATPPTAA